MTTDPVADIITWAAGRPLWQRDALRRLAIAGTLTEADKAELTAFIRKDSGLPVEAEPPEMVPLAAGHLGSGGSAGGAATRLLGIRDVRHVGRMAPDAHLQFSRDGLTAVYGDNGAGKSGYTRILRRAGSGRGDDPKKKILPDVFTDTPAGDATATIIIDGAEENFAWSNATPERRIPGLTVFDSDATQIYVDSGNAIELLPHDLDIIRALIDACDGLRSMFNAQAKDIGDRLEKTCPRMTEGTQAAAFVASLGPRTTQDDIDVAITMTPPELARLAELKTQIAAPLERLKVLTALIPLLKTAAPALKAAEEALSTDTLEAIRTAHFEAQRLRRVSEELNGHLLDGHDLPVGSDVWREMWEAARSFAEATVHPGVDFPSTSDGALCPLCQQELDDLARERFRRLEVYVSAKIRKDADEAARAALARMTALEQVLKTAEESLDKLDLSKEDASLAADLAIWPADARARRMSMDEWLNGRGDLAASPASVVNRLAAFLAKADSDSTRLAAGVNTPEAAAAATELHDLEARQALGAIKSALEERVRDLSLKTALENCAASTNPAPITRFFNTLKERYLTEALLEAYNAELSALNLERLKIRVTPKNDRTAARFIMDLDGRKFTSCKLSEILSEGERRALSLAAFLAEQSIGGGSGCLVFDDPVSSLDYGWTQVIADRLAKEATRRQIVVFTHDLVFYDKLCTAVEGRGIRLEFHKLFWREDTRTSGHVDPTRSDWNSQKVSERIKDLRNLIARARPVATTSPGDYVFAAKGIYGRMRDTWERLIEELLFGGVVQRFQKEVSSMRLKYYITDPEIVVRINAGMTRTSTFSHDNNRAGTDPIPDVAAMEKDLGELAEVAGLLKSHHDAVNNANAGRRFQWGDRRATNTESRREGP